MNKELKLKTKPGDNCLECLGYESDKKCKDIGELADKQKLSSCVRYKIVYVKDSQ